jgi:hypothetical protein
MGADASKGVLANDAAIEFYLTRRPSFAFRPAVSTGASPEFIERLKARAAQGNSPVRFRYCESVRERAARQVSACHAEAFGVGGLGVFFCKWLGSQH